MGYVWTFRTNEFMGGYSNYKFIICISIFNRMAFVEDITFTILHLKRFFVFHFLFPFNILCGFLLYHIFNLHFLSSNNPLRNSTNDKMSIFPFHY